MKQEYLDYLRKNLSGEELKDGIQKLKNGISPQYIVGNVNFYGYDMIVNSNVLIPRFETELLVEKTIYYIRKKFSDVSSISILDVGTGSGCIAIALKKELNCNVSGCDISNEALDVARGNAVSNKVDINFVQSDLFYNIKGKYDVIISNPPYVREDEEIEDIVKNNEPHIALYAKENGLYFYREILKNAKKYLNDSFVIAFEIGELQADEVKKLAFQYLSHICVVVEKDYSYRDRFVFIFSD